MAVLDELGKTQKELVFFSKRDVLICIFSGLNRLSQWPRGLRRRSAAAHLLRSWVQIPLGHENLSVVNVVCCQVEVSATS